MYIYIYMYIYVYICIYIIYIRCIIYIHTYTHTNLTHSVFLPWTWRKCKATPRSWKSPTSPPDTTEYRHQENSSWSGTFVRKKAALSILAKRRHARISLPQDPSLYYVPGATCVGILLSKLDTKGVPLQHGGEHLWDVHGCWQTKVPYHKMYYQVETNIVAHRPIHFIVLHVQVTAPLAVRCFLGEVPSCLYSIDVHIYYILIYTTYIYVYLYK